MKAGYYTGDHRYEVQEIPDRRPVDDEVKSKLRGADYVVQIFISLKEKTEQVLSYLQLF